MAMEPNVHSQWKINLAPVEDQKVIKRLDAVCRRFFDPNADERLVSVERINEGLHSESYRLEYKTKALLLRANKHSDLEEIERNGRLMDYLQKEKHLPVPAFFQPYSIEDEGKLWQCGPFVAGDHFRGTMTELQNAAQTIAVFHQALRTYPDTNTFPTESYGSINPEEWENALEKTPGSAVAKVIESNREKLMPRLDELNTFFAQHHGSPLLREQLIHADLHPQNLIMQNENVAAIIDFGNMHVGRLGVDVGNACHRLVRQFVVNQSGSLTDGLDTFLNAYRKVDSSYTDEDIAALPFFMREILLRKIGFCILAVPEKKYTDTESAEYIARFTQMLNEVDEIESCLIKYSSRRRS